jgi:hypothetical protein
MISSLSYDQAKESVVDCVFPLIYDIYHEEDEWLDEVSLSDNIEDLVDENDVYHVG